jgi:hypothetical protein
LECVSIRSATERIYEEEPPSKSVGCAVASLASLLLLPRRRTKKTPPNKTNKPAPRAAAAPAPRPPCAWVFPLPPLPPGGASNPGMSTTGVKESGKVVDPSVGVVVVVVALVASEEPVCSVVGSAGRVVAVGAAVRKATGVAVGEASGEREGSNVGPAVGSRVGTRSQGSASEGRKTGVFAAESFGANAGEETDTRKGECFVWSGRNVLRITYYLRVAGIPLGSGCSKCR